MANYYLLIGSNQGNRKNNIEAALHQIEEFTGKAKAVSSLYETEAWGLEEQPNFLNQAVHVSSHEKPLNFLHKLKTIEKQIGRVETVKWGPRVIDIDILYIDDQVIDLPELKIPHQGIYDRNFALIPLMEIAGELTDPVKQLTVDDLYDDCQDSREVYIFDESES